MATGGQRAQAAKPGPLVRVARAWRALEREQRVTAIAALSLWVTMFLPWYSENGVTKSSAVSLTLTAFDAFSFVELAVLAVSVAVLVLLFARGERRAFHLPGGDGSVILLAGVWVAALIFYRILDKPSAPSVITGIEWGIFLALAAAIWLAYSGLAMRRAHRAEPRLAEDPTVNVAAKAPERRAGDERSADPPAPVRPARADTADTRSEAERPPAEEQRDHRGVTREDAAQLSFDLPGDGGER